MGVEEFLDFMADTVTINSFTSRSVSGAKTYDMTAAGTKSYAAYIEMKNHLIVNHEGREILARGKVFLGTTDLISVEDLVTLPVGYVPRTPPILGVNIVNDESGNHHVTLEIG